MANGNAMTIVCKCACCITQTSMIEHGREGDYCNCADYSDDERCDCKHCFSITGPMLEATRQRT